jgi:serine/threonine protein kinase/ketosteroid isomerase-like protein
MSHTSSACLSDDEILSLIMGQGGEEESSRIEEHLDSCPSCFDLVSTAAQNLTTTWPPVRPDEPVPAKREHLSQLTLVRRQVVGDRYEILGILGVGGMSIVYLAFDPVLDRQVALKILRRDRLTLDTSVRQQLIREARTVSKLSHPNVVVVFDVGNLENEVFIVLEYIDGQTARDYLTTNSRSLREIVGLYLGASRGLIAAHAAQIVHRDFKPDNVLVGKDGRVRVTDFGLAHVLSHNIDAAAQVTALNADLGDRSSVFSTAMGFVVGTPAYMAPEQHLGLAPDARSDQFSFCVALYEALHKVRPFAGETTEAYRAEVLQGRCLPPPEGHAVPAGVRAALLRGLRPAPEDRFPSMQALVTALLEALAQEESPRAPPPPPGLELPEALMGTLLGLTGGWDLSRRDIVNHSLHTAAAGATAQTWAPNQFRTDARTERWFAAVRGSQAAFAALDLERYLAHFAPDVVCSEPAVPCIAGREGLRPFIASMFVLISALVIEEMHLVLMGQVVSMKYRLRANGRNGREAVLDGVVLFEMNDQDQFARVTSFYDPTSVASLMAS